MISGGETLDITHGCSVRGPLSLFPVPESQTSFRAGGWGRERGAAQTVFSPAWIVQAMCKHFWGLVGAVEVRVAPRYGIRHVAHIRVYVQPEHRPCEITEKLEDKFQYFLPLLRISPKPNLGRLLYSPKNHSLL